MTLSMRPDAGDCAALDEAIDALDAALGRDVDDPGPAAGRAPGSMTRPLPAVGMRRIVRLGDPTNHGGRVVSHRAPHITVDGIPVALVGDRCTCPRKGHGDCVIVEGDPQHTVDGIPVAYEGHLTSCGATLLPTDTRFGKLG